MNFFDNVKRRFASNQVVVIGKCRCGTPLLSDTSYERHMPNCKRRTFRGRIEGKSA